MKRIVGCLCAAIVLASAAMAKESALCDSVSQIVPMTELSLDFADEMTTGKHPDIAIECKAGTELPFKFFGNFGLFSVKFAPDLSFKVEQDCYFRFVKKHGRKDERAKAYISYDLKKWERASKRNVTVGSSLSMSDDKSHVLLATKAEEQ